MNSRITTLLIVGSVLVAAFAAIPASAQVPPLPHAFYGTAELKGSPAPVGAQIEARGTGVKTGIQGNPIAVTAPGRYGGPTLSESKLGVQGTIEDSAPIEFFIDGMKAQVATPGGEWQDSYPFQAGVITQLNLRVPEEASPTPTATATLVPVIVIPTSTPTPSPTATATATLVQVTVGPTATPTLQPTQTPTVQPSPSSVVQPPTSALAPAVAAIPPTPSPMPPAATMPSSAPLAATVSQSPMPLAAAAPQKPAGMLPQPEPATSSSPPTPLQAAAEPAAAGIAPTAQATVLTPTQDAVALASPAVSSMSRSEQSPRAPRPTRSPTMPDGPGQGALLPIIAIGSLVAALLVIATMVVLVLRTRG